MRIPRDLNRLLSPEGATHDPVSIPHISLVILNPARLQKLRILVNVNMVAPAPNFASRRVQILEDRCQAGVHPPAKRSQELRFALLGADYETDVQLR